MKLTPEELRTKWQLLSDAARNHLGLDCHSRNQIQAHIEALEAELKEARGGIAETYKAYLETHELAMHNLKERDTARQEAARYRAALGQIVSSGIDWRAHPRQHTTMERCLEENDGLARQVLGDELKQAIIDSVTLKPEGRES